MRQAAFAALLGLIPLLSACSGSSDTTAEAEAVLRKVADFYEKQQNFQVEFEQSINLEMGQKKEDFSRTSTFVIERPNRVAIRSKDSTPDEADEFQLICDGKQFSASVGEIKQYAQVSAPEKLDEVLARPIMAITAGMGRPPLLVLFTSDPYHALMDGIRKVHHLGRETVDGIVTEHLKGEQEQFDWELWIAAEGDPKVVQARFDMAKTLKALESMPNPEGRPIPTQMITTQAYRNWKFDQKLPPQAFAFAAPEGFTREDRLLSPPRGEASQLVGEPAPDIELELLDGGHFSLKELQGEKVVILDFWATWCGPCVREMPEVIKVAEKYRDRGVALYCVNAQETPKEIRPFLTSKKFKVDVPLDPEGAAGSAYDVSGIPMLVVIDKAGIVQAVHVGFSSNLVSELSQELDTILAGKDLFSKPAKE